MRRNGNSHVLIQLIAIWMIFAVYPWLKSFYQETGLVPQTLLEGLGLLGMVVALFCAVGLVCGNDLARLWSVWLFAIYFLWSFYVVCIEIAPYFSSSLEWLGKQYQVPVERLKGMALILLITHIMWPLIVVMYLTNPGVKAMFNPDSDWDR